MADTTGGHAVTSDRKRRCAVAAALAMTLLIHTVAALAQPAHGESVLTGVESSAGRSIRFAVGEVRTFDHPDFDPRKGRLGIWAPLTMLEDVGIGIYFLEPYDPNRIPVLFVHGMGGTPLDFRRMVASLDRSRFQAWVFHYPGGLPLHSVVRVLHGLMGELQREHGFDAIFVTAHSLGGLVSRSYVAAVLDDGDPRYVALLVTFSSPWDGHPWAAVGAQYMPTAASSWLDVSPGSEFLVSLRNPLQRSGRRVPHYVFFAFRRTPNLVMTDSSDGVVSVASQLPPWVQDQAERCWGYDAEHTSILWHDAALDRYRRLLESEADRLRESRELARGGSGAGRAASFAARETASPGR